MIMAKRILVVDDDPAILEVIEIILLENKYDVETSRSGRVFRDLKNKPDLILLDVLLSGEDGRDIVKKLKLDDKTRDIPVVMISAHPSAGDTVRKFGANDFLSKPFDIDDLLRIIKKNMKKASIHN